MAQQKPVVRIAPNTPVFDLPVIVGIEEGLFAAADLTPEERRAYYDAENRAVDLINADFCEYIHHIAAHAKGALDPCGLLRAFVRYKHLDAYDPVLLTRTYDWMKARGLTEGGSDHATLIAR